MHDSATHWLRNNVRHGWSTCPITQNGCLRIMSQPDYPNSLRLHEVAGRLRSWTETKYHRFWPDDVSLLTRRAVEWKRLLGAKQITDAYLLALAVKRRGRFVSFDSRIDAAAVAGGGDHLEVIGRPS
ncbi:TA system VapC family ribonuclease toxin [Candidatus Foliamicus sp.]